MSAVMFDTLQYSKRLRDAGMNEQLADAQAELNAEIIALAMREHLVTKLDLRDLEMRLYKLITRSSALVVSFLCGLQTLLHFF